MALTLEEIELTITQLQEDLRRAKKARTLLLKKGKQDARLADDLDKLLNKEALAPVEYVEPEVLENNALALASPVAEDIEESPDDIDTLLSTPPEEVIVTHNQPQSNVGALTEEEAEANLDKFF